MNPKSTIILTLRGGKIPTEEIAPGCRSVARFILRGSSFNHILECIDRRTSDDGQVPRVVLWVNLRLEECFADAAQAHHRWASQNIPLGSIPFTDALAECVDRVLTAHLPTAKDLGISQIETIASTCGFRGLFTEEARREMERRVNDWFDRLNAR